MSGDAPAPPDWSKASGDAWARRWRDTDAALAGLAPHLLEAIRERAPAGQFKAFEVGCGPGSTTIDVADACPGAEIVACDISATLAQIARERTSNHPNVRVVVGDAEAIAAAEAPLDLIFSRHGVMFFADTVRAFSALRGAASNGAALVFSCFQPWQLNPWASELAAAAAGRRLPAPGREPGGFAFADPGYVAGLLRAAGWQPHEPRAVSFDYVASAGAGSVDAALSYLSDIGPAARVLETLAEEERGPARERMRAVIERHLDRDAVVFPAAAWIWSATARPPAAA